MKRHSITVLLLCTFLCYSLRGQIDYTAQDTVPIYTDGFLFGSNMGFYEGWKDKELANIATGNVPLKIEGAGVNSLRPALPHKFLERWGYTNKVDEFEFYTSLGIINNSVFIGYPSDEQRDWNDYCEGESSKIFKRMYRDIWDDGENGTPINDENYYALYLYRMVSLYKDHVKFWEVWNEPDLDHGGNAWKRPGMEDNWWENNPPPCEYELKAPIFHYVRMLRITYEVIKYLDPEAYIAIGGLGYPSFLDAVMRNTDEPNNGQTTTKYPLKGGAYFDCMSYHSYPHIDGSLRTWNNDRQDFDYFRHSDAAVDGFIALKEEFETVLHNYDYDGETYPEKVFIVTESNIPRKQFGNYIGSNEAQRNYLIKSLVAAQQNNIQQLCVYDLGEKEQEHQAWESFQMMGLYESLEDVDTYDQVKTDGGVAYTTASRLLLGFDYDTTQTALMNLPADVRGGAFKNEFDEYTYVLWAITDLDRDETASANYDFPEVFAILNLFTYDWDFTESHRRILVDPLGIELTGSPIFLKVNSAILPVELVAFTGHRLGADVMLEWVTESEKDNHQFVVEHRSGNRDFAEIGSVPGAGNTEIVQYYNLKHERAVRGTNYYRLRQEDFNGSIEYSPIVAVNIASNDLFTIRPTQADSEIHIEFYDYYDKDIEMRVVDLLGRVRMDELLIAGRNAKTLDITGLESGHYFIRMKVRGEDYFTRRFVKVKL